MLDAEGDSGNIAVPGGAVMPAGNFVLWQHRRGHCDNGNDFAGGGDGANKRAGGVHRAGGGNEFFDLYYDDDRDVVCERGGGREFDHRNDRDFDHRCASGGLYGARGGAEYQQRAGKHYGDDSAGSWFDDERQLDHIEYSDCDRWHRVGAIRDSTDRDCASGRCSAIYSDSE